MEPFPHHYTVVARAETGGDVGLESGGLPPLASNGPVEFGGPGNRWSPETLLVAALGDCFILTFRAVARASKLAWSSLRVEVEGTLDRVERVTQFTGFRVRASLAVPEGTDEALARRLLEKSERGCLISSSLKASVHLEASVEVA